MQRYPLLSFRITCFVVFTLITSLRQGFRHYESCRHGRISEMGACSPSPARPLPINHHANANEAIAHVLFVRQDRKWVMHFKVKSMRDNVAKI